MSIDDPGGTISDANPATPEGGFLSIMRVVAGIAVAVGAVGSLGFLFHAGESTPRLLLVGFVFWVLSPFVALAWAIKVSKRWSVLTRATLYCVTLVITLGSLAFYGGVISPPAGSPPAVVFVAVAPGSWLFMTIVVSIAALISRRKSRQAEGDQM